MLVFDFITFFDLLQLPLLLASIGGPVAANPISHLLPLILLNFGNRAIELTHLLFGPQIFLICLIPS